MDEAARLSSRQGREGWRGGLQETVHAKDHGDPAPQVRGGTLTTRHRQGDRRLELDGLRGLVTAHNRAEVMTNDHVRRALPPGRR